MEAARFVADSRKLFCSTDSCRVGKAVKHKDVSGSENDMKKRFDL